MRSLDLPEPRCHTQTEAWERAGRGEAEEAEEAEEGSTRARDALGALRPDGVPAGAIFLGVGALHEE